MSTDKVWGFTPRWRWLIWIVYVAAWTTALLMPVPETNWAIQGVEIDLRYLFAKFVHISAYAVLAALSGWLRLPYRYRWLLVFFVMAHGTVTELIQDYTPHRTGALGDVGFDNLGVAIGLLLTWKWWADP